MKDCTGIIISTRDDSAYGELTTRRPDYMIPFGGRYRMIDFSLSNMSNHNLHNVLLYAGQNVRSTLDHIGNGEDWELNRRTNGLVINPATIDELSKLNSEIQTYFDSMTYFEHLETDHIYIEDPMVIAKVDLKEAFTCYRDHDYDAMLLYKKADDQEGFYVGQRKLILDADGSILNLGMNLGTSPEFNLYLDRLFIKTEVFNDLVKDSIEKGSAKTLARAIINHKSELKIGTYPVPGHVEVVSDIDAYYRANMHLLDTEVYDELFDQGGMVYTKSKDEPSTMYKKSAKVGHSLIANGCLIDGQVENSVLFRGVVIKPGAIVRNCILNQSTVVEENAVVINTVTDKYARIESGVTVSGAPNNPYIVGKNKVLSQS